jgi:lactoylglutathione lyase
MAVRFNMIGIFVTDLQKMLAFYRDVIGLEIKQIIGSYAEFEHEGIQLAMFERAKLPEWLGSTPTYPRGLNGTFELALDLPSFKDVDFEFERLVKAGAKEIMKPRDMPWGQRSSVSADPDGNLIEIGSFNKGQENEK